MRTRSTHSKILQYYSGKLVIDADGLTMLSENKTGFGFASRNDTLHRTQKNLNACAENKTTALKDCMH